MNLKSPANNLVQSCYNLVTTLQEGLHMPQARRALGRRRLRTPSSMSELGRSGRWYITRIMNMLVVLMLVVRITQMLLMASGELEVSKAYICCREGGRGKDGARERPLQRASG
jgi:hypothetical protein